MPDVTQLTFVGDWRISVQSRSASWAERVSVKGTAAGDLTLNGNPGQALDVYGSGQTPWTLSVEHNDGQHGWQPNFLQGTTSVSGTSYEWQIGSEDDTSPGSDRDFNDLVVGVKKLGMVAQPVPPFAILPGTLQAMPEGVFEATLGRYFMAVRIQNIWTLSWSPAARVGLTDRCRAWLAAAGVNIIDAWTPADQAAVGQSVSGGKVLVGALAAWATRLIYFKVDVSQAAVRKHQVELQVSTDLETEDVALVSRLARAPISVTRTTFDSSQSAFVSKCDVGTLTAAFKEIVVDLGTFKSAIGIVRKMMAGGGGSQTGSGAGGGSGGALGGCDRRTLEFVRERLRAFLDGKEVDLCALWRMISCCCAKGGAGGGDDGGGDWTGTGLGPSFFAWPSIIEYSVDYQTPFEGQYGPIPFADPFWKVLLVIIAILLTIAAAISGGADLAARNDDVVIGTVTRTVLNALSSSPATPPLATDMGSVDAAVVTLNGNRSLPPTMFAELDAASGEAATTPIVSLGGHIDLPGTFLTNAQINDLYQRLADGDSSAMDELQVFKSGARSGVATGVLMMGGITPIFPRSDDDGGTSFLLNQLTIVGDGSGTALSCHGDSGSLWIQKGTHAVVGLNHAGNDPVGTSAGACRIEDVLTALAIRFM